MKLNCLLVGMLVLTLCSAVEPVRGGPNEPAISARYAEVLRSGDYARLREMLDRGTPSNGRDAGGNTPLMLALVYGNTSCARLLLDRGATVNVSNAAGATPLMRAAHDFE